MHSARLLPRDALCFDCEIEAAIVLKDEDIAPLRRMRNVTLTRVCVCARYAPGFQEEGGVTTGPGGQGAQE
jgi:hypothetical protein